MTISGNTDIYSPLGAVIATKTKGCLTRKVFASQDCSCHTNLISLTEVVSWLYWNCLVVFLLLSLYIKNTSASDCWRFSSHSDQWAGNAESRPGENATVRHEHGDEEELHPGHPHFANREVTWPQNPPCCRQNCGRVGEKQFSHGRQSGEEAFCWDSFYIF